MRLSNDSSSLVSKTVLAKFEFLGLKMSATWDLRARVSFWCFLLEERSCAELNTKVRVWLGLLDPLQVSDRLDDVAVAQGGVGFCVSHLKIQILILFE